MSASIYRKTIIKKFIRNAGFQTSNRLRDMNRSFIVFNNMYTFQCEKSVHHVPISNEAILGDNLVPVQKQ